MIDVTITACRRHEILEHTISSFYNNMLSDHDFRIIVNIDPIGTDVDDSKCVTVCKRYTPHVISNLPPKPNFATAFKWCWTQVKERFILHLEDDWKLLRKVDLSKMLEILKTNENLALLRLPAHNASDTYHYIKKIYSMNWNGTYFECPQNLKSFIGFTGHPSLIKYEFVKQTRRLLTENINPEKQFLGRNKGLTNFAKGWEYGVYSQPHQPAVIKDIGRKWRKKHGFKKHGRQFLKWKRA